jgi:hypothetical protein
MVINEFNVGRIAAFPTETDAILVIDADAEMASAISFELFQAISRNSQIHQVHGLVEVSKFASGGELNVAPECFDEFTFKNLLRVTTREAYYHAAILSRDDIMAN